MDKTGPGDPMRPSARAAAEGPTAPPDPPVPGRQGGHGGADQVQSPVQGPPGRGQELSSHARAKVTVEVICDPSSVL